MHCRYSFKEAMKPAHWNDWTKIECWNFFVPTVFKEIGVGGGVVGESAQWFDAEWVWL